MSLKPEELKEHCTCILQSRRIRNKIVVLCEGDRMPSFRNSRPSPQTYKEIEKLPDANFYRACVPLNWTQYTPQFFNCGDRKNVIDTYFTLLELYQESPTTSYLNPDKLFAFVNRDLIPQNLPENYEFADTEKICDDLYLDGKVNSMPGTRHRILVTELIYKEAYFLIPDLQPLFNEQLEPPHYNNSPLVLEVLYLDIAKQIECDPNIKQNYERAVTRIQTCAGLNCTDCESLSSSWQASFRAASDEMYKYELIHALLTIVQVKKFWKKLQPPSDNSTPEERYREQLSLEIGKYYARNSNDPRYHLPFLLNTLRDSI